MGRSPRRPQKRTTLAGPATYRSLVADYGWPHDRFVDWLATTLSQQLLPASPPAKRAAHG